MNVDIGIDACVFERVKQTEGNKFVSMIGCALVTEDLAGFREMYYYGLQKALKENGFKSTRKVLSSNEILTITQGNFAVHESLFQEVLPKISKVNVIFPILNSKRIPKIKVYGKKRFTKEMTFEEFYNSHLVNSFPHICLWKIYSYVYGTKAKVHIDHFQSEVTEAWDIISKYPDIYCYVNGDMTHVLISMADILCRLIDNRLQENRLFLNGGNLFKILPELGTQQLFSHWIGNVHLPRITMLHSNKVLLNDYIKRPIFHLYLGKNTDLDKKTVFHSVPKVMNYVHECNGCIKFFTPADVNSMKNGDHIICIDKNNKKEVEILKQLWENQLGIKITASDISNYHLKYAVLHK